MCWRCWGSFRVGRRALERTPPEVLDSRSCRPMDQAPSRSLGGEPGPSSAPLRVQLPQVSLPVAFAGAALPDAAPQRAHSCACRSQLPEGLSLTQTGLAAHMRRTLSASPTSLPGAHQPRLPIARGARLDAESRPPRIWLDRPNGRRARARVQRAAVREAADSPVCAHPAPRRPTRAHVANWRPWAEPPLRLCGRDGHAQRHVPETGAAVRDAAVPAGAGRADDRERAQAGAGDHASGPQPRAIPCRPGGANPPGHKGDRGAAAADARSVKGARACAEHV